MANIKCYQTHQNSFCTDEVTSSFQKVYETRYELFQLFVSLLASHRFYRDVIYNE